MIIKAIKLQGTSMLPLFKEGEVVFISPLIQAPFPNCHPSEGGLRNRVVRLQDTISPLKWFPLYPSSSHPFQTARPGASGATSGFPYILHPGDCVVYNFEGKKLLHRIMKTKNNGVWISDDAGLLSPHFVQWENIEGKVLSKNPFASGLTGLIYSKIKSSCKPWFAKM